MIPIKGRGFVKSGVYINPSPNNEPPPPVTRNVPPEMCWQFLGVMYFLGVAGNSGEEGITTNPINSTSPTKPTQRTSPT